MTQSSTARLELTTIRGIACLALVAFHVVGPSSDSGMHLPEASNWHYAVHSLDFLRMPLFSVLSGYFYAKRRVTAETLSWFLKRKIVRLGAPLLFVTAVMLQLRSLAYGDPTSFFQAALFHYEHLWFLQALILIFLAITLSDSFARLSTLGLCLAGFGAVMVSRSFALTSFFSLNGAFYLAPFFLFGMILREERGLLQNPKSLRAALWIVGIVMLVQQAGALGQATPLEKTSLPAVLCGCGAAYAMFVLCPRIAFLETIGTYSYTIYLWHSVSSAAVRPFVEHRLELGSAAEFLTLLAVAIATPIAMHKVAERIPLLSRLVAGIQHSPIPPHWQFEIRQALRRSGELIGRAACLIGVKRDQPALQAGRSQMALERRGLRFPVLIQRVALPYGAGPRSSWPLADNSSRLRLDHHRPLGDPQQQQVGHHHGRWPRSTLLQWAVSLPAEQLPP